MSNLPLLDFYAPRITTVGKAATIVTNERVMRKCDVSDVKCECRINELKIKIKLLHTS